MPRLETSITTRDGTCPASIFTPAGQTGPWPGVLFFMDGLGIRPSFWEMSQQLADHGYCVLLPDLFYRNGPYPPCIPTVALADPGARETIMRNVVNLDRDKRLSDMSAYLEFLAARPEVKPGPFGVTGYCMGGSMAVVAASAFPQYIAAAGSFHGGAMATDQPDSPHLFVGGIKGGVYIAAADSDEHFPESQIAKLGKALSDAKIDYTLETYKGAIHGFAVPDMPVFNPAASSRHWTALLGLFKQRLGI